jgi:Ca2+-binding EF-hand superfamily protein
MFDSDGSGTIELQEFIVMAKERASCATSLVQKDMNETNDQWAAQLSHLQRQHRIVQRSQIAVAFVRVAIALRSMVHLAKPRRRVSTNPADVVNTNMNVNASSGGPKKKGQASGMQQQKDVLANKAHTLFTRFNKNGAGKLDKVEFEHLLVFFEEEHAKLLEKDQGKDGSVKMKAKKKTKETKSLVKKKLSFIPVPHSVCVLMVFHAMADTSHLLTFAAFINFLQQGQCQSSSVAGSVKSHRVVCVCVCTCLGVCAYARCMLLPDTTQCCISIKN